MFGFFEAFKNKNEDLFFLHQMGDLPIIWM